jgi:hypothetical protein
MKQFTTILFSAIIAVLITSCASISPNQKKLVGTWRPDKVEKFDLKNPQTAAAGTEEATKAGAEEATKTSEEETSPAAKAVESRADVELKRMIDTQRRSILTLNADKTLIQDYHGKKINGTWKLKKHGTRMLTTAKESGRKITFNVESVTDTTAVFTAELPVGGVKISYKKMK